EAGGVARRRRRRARRLRLRERREPRGRRRLGDHPPGMRAQRAGLGRRGSGGSAPAAGAPRHRAVAPARERPADHDRQRLHRDRPRAARAGLPVTAGADDPVRRERRLRRRGHGHRRPYPELLEGRAPLQGRLELHGDARARARRREL
ncbi:MAG: hypothetical protein AVDCRST_MAG85-2157, partial [uncultured Solirubrobacteraceae bacterium]